MVFMRNLNVLNQHVYAYAIVLNRHPFGETFKRRYRIFKGKMEGFLQKHTAAAYLLALVGAPLAALGAVYFLGAAAGSLIMICMAVG